ncbi:MAG: DUF4430 domain-containing protein [Candidatus Pacebacteria bacterium]|nr:DUF4430 domain-containing protein [Candidatus Paceibacterota bacterium]
MKRNIYRGIGITLVAIAGLVVISGIFGSRASEPVVYSDALMQDVVSNTDIPVLSEQQAGDITVTPSSTNAGGIGVAETQQFSVTMIVGTEIFTFRYNEPMSLYELLVQARDDENISFDGKNYPGLGFFVSEINNLKSGSEGYLMYDINGTEASVGVSAYMINNGDEIVWQLK